MYTLDVTAATDFPSLCVKDISIASFPNHDFIDLLKNFLPLSTHISLVCDLIYPGFFEKQL